MPGTPAARTPSNRPQVGSKIPRFQKSRPPTIRTMLLPDDYDDLNQDAALADSTLSNGEPTPKKSVVTPGKAKPGARSEAVRAEGPSSSSLRKSTLGQRQLHDNAPAIRSRLGQNDASAQNRVAAETTAVKSPTASASYKSPYRRPQVQKEKPPELRAEPSGLSEYATSPTSTVSPSPFSQHSDTKTGPESAIKAQVVEALQVLDHLEAHAHELGSPSKALSGGQNPGMGVGGGANTARRGGPAAANGSRVKRKAEEKKQLGARRDHAVQVARGIMRKVRNRRA
jgi:hypothetical protein